MSVKDEEENREEREGLRRSNRAAARQADHKRRRLQKHEAGAKGRAKKREGIGRAAGGRPVEKYSWLQVSLIFNCEPACDVKYSH